MYVQGHRTYSTDAVRIQKESFTPHVARDHFGTSTSSRNSFTSEQIANDVSHLGIVNFTY